MGVPALPHGLIVSFLPPLPPPTCRIFSVVLSFPPQATYAAFETFYRTKQALELTLLFEATTTRLMRDHMDMTGALGCT